MVGYMLGGG